ncbi:MAG TPA: VOC family protein [Streptosporangiaceae bacterium]|nr:VOC family protein [Streptosporangiaceae bacterium]
MTRTADTEPTARLRNVLYPVADLDQAIRFYRDGLGLAVKFQDGDRFAALDADPGGACGPGRKSVRDLRAAPVARWIRLGPATRVQGAASGSRDGDDLSNRPWRAASPGVRRSGYQAQWNPTTAFSRIRR